MDSEIERCRAESVRQQQEDERQVAEFGRKTAEELRVSSESVRQTVSDDVAETIANLKSILSRMEAVEALRRDARRDGL